MKQSGGFRHIGKGTVSVVVIEVVHGLLAPREALDPESVNEKNIHVTIIVVVEKSHSRAGGFDDVLFHIFATKDIPSSQPSRRSDVHEGYRTALLIRSQQFFRCLRKAGPSPTKRGKGKEEEEKEQDRHSAH